MKTLIGIFLIFTLPVFIDAQVYWPNDLQYLKSELPKRHKNLFFKMPKKIFEERIDTLIKESMSISTAAIGVRLQQLFAGIGDSHSGFSILSFISKDKILPFQVFWFDDGLYIMSASVSHKHIIGSKINKINGYELDVIADSLQTLLVQDNPSINKAYLPLYFKLAEVLEYFGFVKTDRPITFTLENKEGVYYEKFILPIVEEKPLNLKIEKEGIGFQDTRTFFWESYIPEDSIYFVQYNKCWSKEMEKKYGNKKKVKEQPSFKEFKKKVFATIEEKPINKFIFDMRHNGGGSSLQGTQFVNELKNIKKINKKGKLFVIIGRNTFSSAIINTMNFKKDTEAIVVGEETAGSPDHFGEVKSFKLPSSGVRIRYSTKYFNFTNLNMKSIKPDIAAPVLFSDYLMGKDAAFELAKNYPTE